MAVTSHFRPRHARLPTTFEAFRNRGFSLLWPANFFAYVSRSMQMTLLIWLVLDLTSSPFRVALVGFFGMAPLLLFGAVGGVLVDRVDRRRLLIAMQLLNLTAGVAMVTLLLTEMVQYWHAYLVVLASGLGWAFDMPSRRSIVLDLIGRAKVTNAMALDSMGMHASRMAGPALAGGFIAAVGVTGGYYAIIALYSLSIAFLAPLRLPARVSQVASMSIARNLADGFAYVRTDRIILTTVIITVLMNLLLFPYMQMVPVIARDTLGIGPGLMGILMGADGLGAIIGSVSIASARQIKYHGRVYLAGSLIALTMVLVFAASRWFALSLPVLVLLGLGAAGFATMQSTIVVLAAREEMRGRTLGVISLAIGAGPIGALMIGAVAEATSPATAVTIFASLGLITVGTVGWLMAEIRGPVGQPSERVQVESPIPVVQRTYSST